jgi:hypothetical protein
MHRRQQATLTVALLAALAISGCVEQSRLTTAEDKWREATLTANQREDQLREAAHDLAETRASLNATLARERAQNATLAQLRADLEAREQEVARLQADIDNRERIRSARVAAERFLLSLSNVSDKLLGADERINAIWKQNDAGEITNIEAAREIDKERALIESYRRDVVLLTPPTELVPLKDTYVKGIDFTIDGYAKYSKCYSANDDAYCTESTALFEKAKKEYDQHNLLYTQYRIKHINE